MSKSRKVVLLAAAGFVTLLLLVGLSLLLLVNADTFKSGVETAASDALGMEVEVDGRPGIGLFPGLHARLPNVRIRNRGSEIISAQEVGLEIALLPLLRREFRIVGFDFRRPVISIERSHDGRLNFENASGAKGALPVLETTRIVVSDATIRYTNKPSGEVIEAEACNLDLHDLRLSGGQSRDLLKQVSLAGHFGCARIRRGKFAASDLKMSIAARAGVFTLEPLTVRIFDGQGSASIQANFSGEIPRYQMDYSLLQFRIETFFQALSPEKVAEGVMDSTAKLAMQGNSIDAMKRTAAGAVSLRGAGLTVYGHDLDRKLSRYESSQNFNLVDVGAYFFAGPIGLAVTKGSDFASIFEGAGGSSEIRTLVSDWEVERGVAQAQDVAMATNENRIALRGNLDFVNDQFDQVTVAIIDARGCARVEQAINGPFHKPVVEQPNVLVSLAGPVLEIIRKGREIFPGGQCEVFYAGTVTAPE